jgi:hypothetical protein
MGVMSSITSRIRGLFGRRRAAHNDGSPGHEHDLEEIVHERAMREAALRREGDSGGSTPTSSSYL